MYRIVKLGSVKKIISSDSDNQNGFVNLADELFLRLDKSQRVRWVRRWKPFFLKCGSHPRTRRSLWTGDE